jgi:DnaJ-like protein
MTTVEACSLLGLPVTFSASDLKRAYRRAAAANHPDCGGDAERMVLVNEAYEVLSSPGGGDAFELNPEHEQKADKATSWLLSSRRFFRFRSRRQERPWDKYVVRVSAAVALCAWIAGMVDSISDFRILRSWILLGLPFSYLMISLPLRFVVGFGIHVYHFGLKLRGRVD